jgi:putative ABC transport system permease protein
MINLKDLLMIGLTNLRNRKKRTFLTILGIIIGISSVVALVSVGQGLSKSIDDELEKLGTDIIFVQAKTAMGVSFTGTDDSGQINKKDLDIVRKITGVKEAAGFLAQPAKVSFGREERTVYVFGYPEKSNEAKLIDDVNTWKIEEGRMISPGGKGRVVLGSDLAKKTFEKKINIGNKIFIDGKEFKVVGIFKKLGDPGFDKGVLVSEDVLRVLYNRPFLFSYLYIRVGENENVEIIAERIERALRKERGQKEGQEDFSVQTPVQMIESFSIVLDIITTILIGIAAISLLVGGVGIMNTMYTSVLERTKEIGVMKAIGAKNKDIMFLFLIESGVLGLVGGFFGIVIGFSISKGVEFAAAQALGVDMLKVFFPWYLILGALFFSFLVGALSGFFPARRASRLKPVDSLRYE